MAASSSSSSNAYVYRLPSNLDSGSVNGITVRWQASAVDKLEECVDAYGFDTNFFKAMTEHFLYLSAHRLGSGAVKILGPPHTFTKNSVTGEVTQETNVHVSGELSGGQPGGRYKVHVYIDGLSWENMDIIGEGVVRHKQKVIDPRLSQGYYPQVNQQAQQGQQAQQIQQPSQSQQHQQAQIGRSSNSRSRRSGPSSRGTTQSASGGNTADAATVSEWVLSADGQTYQRYNYATQQYEYY